MIRTLLLHTARTVADRRGVTAAEYAVLAAAIVGLIAGVATAFGTKLTTAFTNILS